MSRPREFDEEQVLEQAMQAFWAKGFEATTLDDLELATGLGRGSIYGAFGDKRALFLRAIERYLGGAIARHAARLDPDEGKAAIVGFFAGVCAEALGDVQQRGCMLTNCAIELAGHDRDVAVCVGRHLQAVEGTFVRAIETAQERGEIAPGRDPVSLARVLIAALHGLQVMAKARPDRSWMAGLDRAIEQSL